MVELIIGYWIHNPEVGSSSLLLGTSSRYIKDILGHFDIRITERYLHVSKNNLVNIISPLDDLGRKGKID